MDNQQFRRLLINTPKPSDGKSATPASSRPSATPLLGSRKHSSIPMTPRQIGRGSVQSDFARQLAERNAKADPSKKKFRSAAPKGTKLAAGYTDRTKNRVDDDENETAQRIKNLEEVMKAGQIDRETFEKLVLEITGGDIGSTHLVKGLDRKLLERVRKGEDVLGGDKEEEVEPDDDVEDVFDELAEKKIGPIVREKMEKRGEMAPPPPLSAGIKRSRDTILAQLKAERKAAAEAAAAEHEKRYPTLGEGFRKVTPQGETTRIEVDSKGREVLIVTDADGKEKRKVRKQKIEESVPEIRNDIDNEKKPINMHNLPEPKPVEEESEDEDIFVGVGSTYNPLADLEGDEDDSSSEEEDETKPSKSATAELDKPDEEISKSIPRSDSEGEIPEPTIKRASSISGEDSLDDTSKPTEPTIATAHMPPPSRPKWFTDTPTTAATTSTADAMVAAALAKVRTLDADSTLLLSKDEIRLRKRAAELANNDRDMEDMDMDFGSSRFDDAADMEREGEKVKFSEWRGLGAEEDGEDEAKEKKGEKRKRGGKKRKGDKHSAVDVLQAMERQQKTKKVKTLG